MATRKENIPNMAAISDWPTQLSVLKFMYNTEDLHVKYLDDENEEIRIESQNDYEFANQIAISSTNSILRLVLTNSRDEIIGKTNLYVDLGKSSTATVEAVESLNNSRVTTSTSSSIESMMQSSNMDKIQVPTVKALQQPEAVVPPPPPFTRAQIDWLDAYMHKFKTDLLNEIGFSDRERKLVMLPPPPPPPVSTSQSAVDLISFETTADINLEARVNQLFGLITEARLQKRALKAAYLEEELQSTGAFNAEFIKDETMPDGSQCDPGVKFEKCWIVKNTGKLDWSEANCGDGGVKLVCIAGNILPENDIECVDVNETRVGDVARISVALIAPPTPGTYFSEWVLCCTGGGFKFGPRIWCTIQVVGSNNVSSADGTVERKDLSLVESMYSERAAKRQQQQQQQKLQQRRDASLAHEDVDDEFVVIPDCFDLDKKWTCKQQRTAKDSEDIIEPPQHSHDLIMLNSDDAYHLKSSKETNSDKSSSLESSIERIGGSNSSAGAECEVIKQGDEFVISRLTIGEKLSLSETQDPKFDLDDDDDDDDDNIEPVQNSSGENLTPPTVTSSTSNSTKSSQQYHHVNSNTVTQAFGVMKDALSNLGRPSYVGSIQLAAASSESVDNETESVDAKMRKLVSMGFANRPLNAKLLRKHNNDLQKVIQNLLEINDNDWHESR